MNAKAKGYLLGSIAAATYGMNPLFALPLYSDGMDPNSVLFFRYAFAIPILALMLRLRGRSFKMNVRKELPAYIILGLLLAMSSLTLFLSYNYMAAGIATTILFVYPLMVAIIMALVYKEKITLQTAFCIFVAIAGISLLYKSDDGTTLSVAGTIFVLLSALSYAIYIVGINYKGIKDLSTIKVTFYIISAGFFVFLIPALVKGYVSTPDKWYLWFNLLALAILPTVVSFVCTTVAIHDIGSTPVAILGALEPVTAVFFGVLLFNETLSFREVIGLLLIIGAVTVVIMGTSITHFLVRIRKMLPRLNNKKY